jgi:hypothetical protein
MTMTETFALLFQPPSVGLEAVGPTARVYLSSSILSRCCGGNVFLSRQCLSVHDLRSEIDRLQKELEYLWHVGRRSFSDLA